jgi:hypothetical protein
MSLASSARTVGDRVGAGGLGGPPLFGIDGAAVGHQRPLDAAHDPRGQRGLDPVGQVLRVAGQRRRIGRILGARLGIVGHGHPCWPM